MGETTLPGPPLSPHHLHGALAQSGCAYILSMRICSTRILLEQICQRTWILPPETSPGFFCGEWDIGSQEAGCLGRGSVGIVMINVMCQLGPDIWSNVFLDISSEVFLGK